MHQRKLRTGAAVAALLVWACASVANAATELKIATVAPDGTAWMQQMRAGAAQIAQRTAGRVTFKFYPGGTMGSDKTVLRKIRIGQLQGGALTAGSLSEIYPDSQIYSMPFAFRSYAELDYVRARMDRMITDGLLQHGFVNLGLGEGGFAYLMSNDPIRRIEDLKDKKIWIPEGDIISRTVFHDLGVSPIPLPLTDVLTGLETGLINTVGSSPVGAIALQWHTRIKYVTDMPILFTYGALVIDHRAFDRIAPADQVVVRSVMRQIFVILNKQNRLDNEHAKAALRNQGIRFVTFSASEQQRLHSIADAAVHKLSQQGVYSAQALKTLQSDLDAYRRIHAPAAAGS